MSTTWVFLGLLAGREFAIVYVSQLRKPQEVRSVVLSDMTKALIGLAVSLVLAFSAPYLKNAFVAKKSDTIITEKESTHEIEHS